MPTEAGSGDPVVIVIDTMEFRRALVVHFLKDWAAAQKVELLSFVPQDAHQALRDGVACRMIVFNAGVAACSSPETLAEIRVLRALAPSACLIVVAAEEIREDVVAVMQSGAEGYLSNQSSPDLVLRALSFVLEGGTCFPRSVVTRGPFPDEAPLRAGFETSRAVPRAIAAAAPTSHLPDLSDRQKAILEGVCRGEPNKIIGRALNLPESTVKVHVREIMRKLSVSNRTQVAVVVSKLGAASGDRHGQGGVSASGGSQGGELLDPKRKPQAPPICPDGPAEATRACQNNALGSFKGYSFRKDARAEQRLRAIPFGLAKRGMAE